MTDTRRVTEAAPGGDDAQPSDDLLAMLRRAHDGQTLRGGPQLTPRARLHAAADAGSVLEIAPLARGQQPEAGPTPADGVHAALGRIHGTEVVLVADDPAVLADTDGEVARSKRQRAVHLAARARLPLVLLLDGTVAAPDPPDVFAGQLLGRMSDPRERLEIDRLDAPVVAAVFGPLGGRSRELLASADLVVAVAEAAQDLGVDPGHVDPGHVDIVAVDAAGVVEAVRTVFAALSGSGTSTRRLPTATPADGPTAEDAVPCSVAETFASVVDEVTVAMFPTTGGVVPALARVAGHPVLVIGTGRDGTDGTVIPAVLSASCLRRLRRLVGLAHAAGIPLIVLQDCSGYGTDVRDSPDLVTAVQGALRTAAVPRLCVVTGAGHVLGSFVLGGRELGGDVVLAWPWARLATWDPGGHGVADLEAVRHDGPWLAAGFGLVDDVVTPAETRAVLGRWLDVLLAAGPRPRTDP